MGRKETSGTSNGTSGAPQTSLEQEQLANDMAQAEQKLIQETEEMLFAQLDQANVKYTRGNVLFIARDETGQIVFLETGNEFAGFKHILKGHADDFKRALNLDKDDIPAYLKNVVQYGKVTYDKEVKKKNRTGFYREYYYGGEYYIITGIGTNGFMVSAYPSSKSKREGGNS